jgi:hypothetical protein
MSRGRAPPFKQRIAAALEAAKAAGADRVTVKTPDGASYEFALSPEVEGAEPVNDIDRIYQNLGKPIPGKNRT